MRAKGDVIGDEETELDEIDDEFVAPPPEMMGAPTWAQYLHTSQRQSEKKARKRDLVLGRRLFLLEKTMADMNSRLGYEAPDGSGGTGFVGETRRNSQDIDALKGERNFVRGAIAAITAAGTLLVYGFSAWIRNLIQSGSHK